MISGNSEQKMDIAQYTQYNESFCRTCTFQIGKDAGFFSEYNNMILAMAYCLIHHVRFQITSEGANFNPKQGWNGFFIPFCQEVPNDGKHYKTADWRFALKRIGLHQDWHAITSLLPYFTFWKRQMRTQDVFGKCRDRKSMDRYYSIQELDFKGNIQQLCAELVRMTWKYNDDTREKIEELIAPLNLPDRYIGIHIRGGDKFVEHEIEPIQKYFSLVSDLTINNLFVLTDDYTIIEQIKATYPSWNVYTLCHENERGYFHDQFVNQPFESQRLRLIKLFASMEVLNRSLQFIGTFSSNPGMFMGMRNPSICTGVDFDHWLIW